MLHFYTLTALLTKEASQADQSATTWFACAAHLEHSFHSWVIPCEKMRFWTSGFKIVFFGPKQVSWTAWGALGPILASPSHLRVNFHSWVAFWVCRAPKIPNKLLISFFVILLSFLHPKGWNKSTFDVQGPKPAINSKNEAKIAKKSYAQKAIFWKNISFDFA